GRQHAPLRPPRHLTDVSSRQSERGGNMAERKVRYMLEDAAPFSIHADGLLIQAVTRKSEVPVTVEIEGVSRRMLLQFQAAIEQELARREAAWKQERQRVLHVHRDSHEVAVESSSVEESQPSVDRPSAA